MFAACGEKDNKEHPQPTTPQQQWPEKRISSIKKLFKKKNWAFYLFMFCVFAVVFLLIEWLFDKNTLGHAMIGGLISGGIMTALWWFFDQAHEHIQESVKEDETNRKREK